MSGQDVEIRLDERDCLAYSPEYDSPAENATSYWNPRGPDPGFAYCLMLEGDVRQLDTSESMQLTLSAGDSVGISRLWFDNATCVSGGIPPDDNRAFLVKLWDSRKILNDLTCINKQFNVHCPTGRTLETNGSDQQDYYVDSLDAEQPYTWSRVCETIWKELPATLVGAFPGLPLEPYGTPRNLRYLGVNAWHALHDVLKLISCTTVYDPQNDKFTIINLAQDQFGLSDAYQNNQGRLLEDNSPYYSTAPYLPETIRVFFVKQAQHAGTEPDSPRQNNWLDSGMMAYGDVPTGAPGAVPGTRKELFAGIPAIIDFQGNVVNSAEGVAHATFVAQQWVNDRLGDVARQSKLYQGIVADFDTPGSQITAVSYFRSDNPNDADDPGGLCTQVILGPNKPFVPGEPVFNWGGDKPSESLREPDLARHTTPNYPRAVQLIQLDDNKPDASGYYTGHVVRYNPEGPFDAKNAEQPEQLEVCLAVEASPHMHRRRETCATYYGRLNGIATSDGITAPLYVLESGAGQILLGKALADIAPKETGTITVWEGAPGAEIATTTAIQLYNSGAKITAGDTVYFTSDCTGPRLIPTAVKPILGKTTENIANAKSGKVDVYSVPDGEMQGQEAKVDPSKQITAFNKTHGYVPKDRWVICQNTGDGWYITDPIQGDILLGRVPLGESAGQVAAYFPPTQIEIQIQPSDQATTYEGDEPKVSAFVRFFPVFDGEQVAIAWTGSVFHIVQSEFAGGILGKSDAAGISKGGSSNAVSVAINGDVPGAKLAASVKAPLGSADPNKLMWISRNKNGFYYTSGEC